MPYASFWNTPRSIVPFGSSASTCWSRTLPAASSSTVFAVRSYSLTTARLSVSAMWKVRRPLPMMNRRTASGSEVPGISTMIWSGPCRRMDGSVRPNWSIRLFRTSSARPM